MYSKLFKEYNLLSESGDSSNIKDDLLKQDFSVTGPDQKIVNDTTGIRTKKGWLYVARILDLGGRISVGMATSPRNDTELVSMEFGEMRQHDHGGNGCILPSSLG